MKDPVSVISGVGPGTGSALAVPTAMGAGKRQHHCDGLGDDPKRGGWVCLRAVHAKEKGPAVIPRGQTE